MRKAPQGGTGPPVRERFTRDLGERRTLGSGKGKDTQRKAPSQCEEIALPRFGSLCENRASIIAQTNQNCEPAKTVRGVPSVPRVSSGPCQAGAGETHRREHLGTTASAIPGLDIAHETEQGRNLDMDSVIKVRDQVSASRSSASAPATSSATTSASVLSSNRRRTERPWDCSTRRRTRPHRRSAHRRRAARHVDAAHAGPTRSSRHLRPRAGGRVIRFRNRPLQIAVTTPQISPVKLAPIPPMRRMTM